MAKKKTGIKGQNIDNQIIITEQVFDKARASQPYS